MKRRRPVFSDLIESIKSLVATAPDRHRHEASIRARLDALPAPTLSGLDYEMRWSDSWRTHRWESMPVAEAERLLAEATDVVTVAAGLSLHRHGHIRQAAVTALVAAHDPRALPWLVLRCGDWVPEVRDRARRGVDPWLVPDRAAALVDLLPLLDGGRFGPGRPHRDLRERVVAVLSEPAARPAVEQGTRSTSRPVRRACVRLVADTGADVALLEQMMHTDDVVAIALVAAALPTEGPVNRTVGGILLRSPMARFRSEGLWRLTRDDGPGSETLAGAYLTDSAPSVRDVAQRWLTERGHDVTGRYRAMAAENPLAMLRGLGDRPDPGDGELVALAQGYVDHTAGPIRVAALRLLAAVGNEADRPLFAQRFLAGTAKERRYALAGLRRVGVGEVLDSLWAEARTADGPEPAERLIYQALALAGRWQQLDVALQAVAEDDPAVSKAGVEALHRLMASWNRGYTSDPPDPALLRTRLGRARPVLEATPRRFGQPDLVPVLDSLLGP